MIVGGGDTFGGAYNTGFLGGGNDNMVLGIKGNGTFLWSSTTAISSVYSDEVGSMA